jgi:Putative beta barrel porin-7 (BBP7)
MWGTWMRRWTEDSWEGGGYLKAIGYAIFFLLACCATERACAQESPEVLIEEEPAIEADRIQFRADYLYWWLYRLKTPPLLTSGPTGSSGILGESGTSVLRGGDRITSRHDRYIGVRGGFDWWFGRERNWGFELDAFFLERDSTHYTVRHGQVPVLALPYVDQQGQDRSFVVSGFNAELGNLLGSTRVYSRMELFGQEGNALLNLVRAPDRQVNLIAGFRALQLRERLDLTSSASILPEMSTVIGLEDHFQTFNKFYGGQIGTSGTLRAGRWSIDGRVAVALGASDQEIRNKGQFIYHTPQQRQAAAHGLFVLPSNSGLFERVSFDVVTEVRLNVACDLTRWLNVHVGYSLLTWNGPVRPGDQVVPINRTQIQAGGLQGVLQPLPQFKEDLYWAHGLNAGFEVHW